MLILWDGSRVKCDVLGIDSQHIHLRRRKLWDHLTLVGSSLTLPWIIAGDFNCYSSSNDKVGGGTLRPYDIKDLLNFRMALGLEDAPSMGSFFTWTNGSI
ncbi:hypothetical protein LIER_18701 [Lithospermum erythrorhizon]|uniref:Endonuclease/exonuclease/phosphatase domain-containing protein n=1 Tax=Lithospermum erythrorhizon TaxID=34254 RepID=A0AAV3QGM8_LITER